MHFKICRYSLYKTEIYGLDGSAFKGQIYTLEYSKRLSQYSIVWRPYWILITSLSSYVYHFDFKQVQHTPEHLKSRSSGDSDKFGASTWYSFIISLTPLSVRIFFQMTKIRLMSLFYIIFRSLFIYWLIL